ncbi:hypothetical protein DSO57_1008896 [Entomophthora muscae]|uniref:Uncharacterized protein n=1 Tax=Entomophthora muscae TaxID=34485 RepID=A0ACC2TUT8_9FUNG|nr:hypothetical protein DSO57_1008896 [Entomophthora muscae]
MVQRTPFSTDSSSAPPTSRFGELLAPSSIHPENTTLPSMMVPYSYKGEIFHVALWAIHSSAIHSFEEESTPAQIHQALVAHKLSWSEMQALFDSSKDKMCKAITLKWAIIPGLVIIDTEFSVNIVSPELNLAPPFPLSPPDSITLSPLTPTLLSQKGFSPTLQVSLLPST